MCAPAEAAHASRSCAGLALGRASPGGLRRSALGLAAAAWVGEVAGSAALAVSDCTYVRAPHTGAGDPGGLLLQARRARARTGGAGVGRA